MAGDDLVGRLRESAIAHRVTGDEVRGQLIDAAADEIERLRARPCPYTVTADEGTSYCTLAEQRPPTAGEVLAHIDTSTPQPGLRLVKEVPSEHT